MSNNEPEKSTSAEDLDDDYLSARSRLIFGGRDDIFQPIATLQEKESPLRAPLDAFQQNLASALTVGSIPFQLAHSSVLNLRFSQILTSERIRTLKKFDGQMMDEASREPAAQMVARKRMTEELEDKASAERRAQETLKLLYEHITEPEFGASCEELLRQVLVMSWGAFETIFNDLLRLLLNLKPHLVKDLSQVRPFKDLLTARTLLEGIENANFDLTNRMGDFLSELISIDSIEKIQSTAQILFHSAELDTSLKNQSLWRVTQQRHLIVHRRSVVDARYRERTGDNAEIGTKLVFDSDYVEDSMALLVANACLLYEAACSKLVTP